MESSSSYGEVLKRKVREYLKTGQLNKDAKHTILKDGFIKKAWDSYDVAKLLLRISKEEKMKELLRLPKEFSAYDWVVVISYYSMYASALAALAAVGYKSKSHAATITVLKFYYLLGEKLDFADVFKLIKAHSLSSVIIDKLIKIKEKRETAQYEIKPGIPKQQVETIFEDAKQFIQKIEEVIK